MAKHRKEARSSLSSGQHVPAGHSCMIVVRVVPRSSKIVISQEAPDTFKIRLTAAPVDGAANAQLLKVLSEKLTLPSRNILLISGEKSKVKRFRIEGLNAADISERLTAS